MKTTDKLHDALAMLEGKTPDEIAKVMAKNGVKGRPGTTGKCPLAIFFNAVQAGQFVIGRDYIMRVAGKTQDKARTPGNLATFVRRFDIGKYPELIAMPPRCLAQSRERDEGRARPSGKQKPRRQRINHFAKDVGRFATA